MPKGRGFLGCSQRTRHAHPQVKRCDRLTRALGTWLSPPLHRRTFPQALRYCTQSTTRRARAPFIPRTEGRGLLTEKDKASCAPLRDTLPLRAVVGQTEVALSAALSAAGSMRASRQRSARLHMCPCEHNTPSTYRSIPTCSLEAHRAAL